MVKKRDLSYIGIFVVRYYGGAHFGKRRFEIAESLTEKAVQRWLVKKNDRKSRTRIDSLTSLASTVSESVDVEENAEDLEAEQGEPEMPQ